MMASHKSGSPTAEKAAVHAAIGDSEATRLTVRLWSGETGDQPIAATWRSEHTTVYMIADLVAATYGTEAGEFSANFKTAAQAVQAAKRILFSVHAFALRCPMTCRAAAIILGPDGGPESALAGAWTQQLLDQARPGQIVVLEKTCKQLEGMPSVQVRSYAVASQHGAETAAVAYELIWSHPDWNNAGTTALPGFTPDEETEKPAVLDEGDLGHSSVGWKMLVGLALIAVVAVLFVLVNQQRKPAAPHVPPVAQAISPPVQEPQAPTVLALPADTGKPERPIRRERKEKPIAKVKAGAFEGFSPRDIPDLLKRADHDAGSGDYSEARSEYNHVLEMEPGNARAKAGLLRLELRENER